MRISDMNWMQVEENLRSDDRAVLPLGSTEQNAWLSLSTDSILAERVSMEAAEPLGVPVFPALAYGITPAFMAYPGTLTLRMETYLRVVGDLLDSLARHGFRRIVLVNGHGGNRSVDMFAAEWMASRSATLADVQVKYHEWWCAPRTWRRTLEIDPAASHASWMENFPWTRLAGVTMPGQPASMDLRAYAPRAVGVQLREQVGSGNFGGLYQRSDEEMLSLWQVAVAETREVIDQGWA
jgi:creatinine amidohydrolase